MVDINSRYYKGTKIGVYVCVCVCVCVCRKVGR